MSKNDKFTSKLHEVTSDPRVRELGRNAEQTLRSALALASGLAHDNRDKVHGFLDKAAVGLDRQTKGRYAQKVSKARASAHQGFDRLADWAPQQNSGSAGTSPSGTGMPARPDQATSGATGDPLHLRKDR